MALPALRPRSPSELVDAAFQILRAHYPQFVMCSALAYLPWLVVQIVWYSDPSRPHRHLAAGERGVRASGSGSSSR
jgi:hypothetical protein